MASHKPFTTLVDTKQKLSTSVDIRMMIVHYIIFFMGLYSISKLFILASLMLFNKCVFTCMLPEPTTLKYITHYVQGTLQYGLHIYHSPTKKLVSYTGADWVGFPDTHWFTFGYYFFLGENLISGSTKRQPTLSHSSVDTKYRGVANVVSKSFWLHNLILELHFALS